ncbi:hypothetical protein VNO78_29008 [Psophocarpus tetragonolobus]|uniref:Uncharacterized protein n=1 Tax=Psophocarpus tetragonolobus TaxID=3891 RepID=A0AAN9RU90_PSOTE
MVWAHSVSYDLINWIHLNHAIEPSEPYDINSCWSGSATILPGEEQPIILYTGIDNNKHQVQNLVMPKNLSDPFLREWVKHPQNPVITPPNGVEVNNFRDPSTAWLGKDGKWRVVIGAQNGDEGKAVLYQNFFPVSINSLNGVDTSVPNQSVRHVLKISYFRRHEDYYFLGKYVYDEANFIPDVKFTGTSLDLRYDYGKFYASKSFFDHAKSRRILWGWVNECDTTQDDVEKGWAGLQCIPRQVWLDENGKRLMQWPIEEVEKLRDKQISIIGEKLVGGSTLEVSGITASQRRRTSADGISARRSARDDGGAGGPGEAETPRSDGIWDRNAVENRWNGRRNRDEEPLERAARLISAETPRSDGIWAVETRRRATGAGGRNAISAAIWIGTRRLKRDLRCPPFIPVEQRRRCGTAGPGPAADHRQSRGLRRATRLRLPADDSTAAAQMLRSGIIGPFGLLALASEDQTEHTAIFFRIYRATSRYLCLMCSDQSRSSLRQDLDKATYGTIFDIVPNLKTISLRSLIDRSIIESFGEKGKICITSRVYPSLAIDKDAHLYVFNNGSKSVVISELNAWSMKQAEFGQEKSINK